MDSGFFAENERAHHTGRAKVRVRVMGYIRKEIIGDCELYLADCLEVDLNEFNIDAVITDPMYGNKYDCTKNRSRNTTLKGTVGRENSLDPAWFYLNNSEEFNPLPWLGYKKVVLWGGNFFSSRLPSSTCWLVWDKKCHTTSDNHSDCELAWTNLDGVVRRYFHLWRGLIREGRENASNGQKLHPFQKPRALMRWCIDQCKLKPGSVVLDPYMGSATTGVACIDKGMKFVGVEKEEEVFNTACCRIEEAHRTKPRLFGSLSQKPEQQALF